MTCNCITEINEKLPEHTLDVAICFSRERNELTAQTYTRLERRDNRKHETRRTKPRLFGHTFCPFCGIRYEPAPAVEGGAA